MAKYKKLQKEDGVGIREHVVAKVNNAPDYYDGQIEALERQVSALTDLLGLVAESLPNNLQDRLAKKMGLIKCRKTV